MTRTEFGFDVQNTERTKKQCPPARPVQFAEGCATCGQGQQFTVTFTCPGCGHNVQPN